MKYYSYEKKLIECCAQCRFCKYSDVTNAYSCKRCQPDELGFLRQIDAIPGWCPLPDAIEENMKEAA